ncbi:MAG: glycosyltransferase family 4 protein [Pseudomonadota bacterium]
MKLRIAYFINQYPKVSHSFIRREILALERQGFEVQRIALRGWNEAVVDSDDISEKERTRYLLQGGLLGLPIALLRALLVTPWRFMGALALAIKMSRRADRALPYHLIYLAEACRLLVWVRSFGARHVHAHFGTNSTEVVMLASVLGGPGYSFTVHGPEEFDKPQFIHLEEKIRRSKFAVAVSSYGRSQLFRWVDHTQWAKVHVVHCGLDAAFYNVPPTDPPDVPRLVCVGRLCEQKGQLLLISALALIAQRGIAWELVLAGDGEMRADVEALIARHSLQSRVRITGWINSVQVREEILAARAMVLPSFAEGLPVVIMEAMSLRRPVLTTAVAGIPELVRHEESGWLFAAGSIDELADAITSCLATPADRLATMGQAAHTRVLQRHSIDTEVTKLAQHLTAAIV